MLHSVRTGSGPRLVLVHGFTQTGASWSTLAAALASDHEVVQVDAPGHGRSPVVDIDLPAGAALLAATGGRATYVGYSMGGRYCLRLALDHTSSTAGLVLVGATAGIDEHAAREERRAADERLAARLEQAGVVAFVDEWLAQPLFAGLPPEAQGREHRLTNSAEGLAASLRRAGTGAQQPLWDRLQELTIPVLVVTGERDEKFRRLGERLIAGIGPTASMAVVPGAGHAVHLERPDEFLGVLRSWLRVHGL